MTSPLAPRVSRAAADGVPYTAEEFRDVGQSIGAMASIIVEGAGDKDVCGVAADALIDAGIDGRSGHLVADIAQAMLDYVTSDNPIRVVFSRDPLMHELTVTAAGLLCLRPGLCIRKGDCDDVTALCGALVASCGIIVRILLITYRRDATGRARQQHVVLGVKDERGEILALDAQFKGRRVGALGDPLIESVTEFDPYDVLFQATGQDMKPQMVTYGSALHQSGRASVGVGDAGNDNARDLRWDGFRYWEKRRDGAWFVQDGDASWRRIGIKGPLASELQRLVSAENANASTVGRGTIVRVGVGERVEPNPGSETADKARAEAAGSEIAQAMNTLRRSVTDLRSTSQAYAQQRADLGLPAFEPGPSVVEGPADFARDAQGRIVWSPAVLEYVSWIGSFADHLIDLASQALDGERTIAFTESADIVIQAFDSDAFRYVLSSAAPGARTVQFQDAAGATQWTMDENGERSRTTNVGVAGAVGVGAWPVIAIVAIIVVVAIALYFIVAKICDVVTTSINEKASSTIAQAVLDGKLTPEQAQLLLQADADRRAKILAAETEKQKADPFASTVAAVAEVGKVLVVGAGVVGAAYLVSLAIPAVRAWRAGVPKRIEAEPAAASEPRKGTRFTDCSYCNMTTTTKPSEPAPKSCTHCGNRDPHTLKHEISTTRRA